MAFGWRSVPLPGFIDLPCPQTKDDHCGQVFGQFVVKNVERYFALGDGLDKNSDRLVVPLGSTTSYIVIALAPTTTEHPIELQPVQSDPLTTA